jgi:PilZ domain
MTNEEKFGPVRSFSFRSPRVTTSFSFSVEVIATGERYDAMCTDISEDGIAAELLEPLAAREPVMIRMLLPGAIAPLQIQGKVEHSDGGRCGLNFVYSSPDERRQVQLFVQSIS